MAITERTEQLRTNDRVCRYGGEELLVPLPEQGQHEAAIAMERAHIAVQALALEHRGSGPLAC